MKKSVKSNKSKATSNKFKTNGNKSVFTLRGRKAMQRQNYPYPTK